MKDHQLKRTYRAKNSSRIFVLVFLAFSLFFVFSAWRGISAGHNTWLDLAIALVLVLAGSGFAAQTFTARLVLSDESISQESVFRKQLMCSSQIRYRREYEEYQDSADGIILVHYLEFIPYDVEARSLKISKDEFDLDRTFWDWVFLIPELERT